MVPALMVVLWAAVCALSLLDHRSPASRFFAGIAGLNVVLQLFELVRVYRRSRNRRKR